MTVTNLPDLRIPPGELLTLPKGWSHGGLYAPNRRVLKHETGRQVIVTEMAMDETVDGWVLRRTLELALESWREQIVILDETR